MNQKERLEAFRRGQNEQKDETWTEEEWKARRALRRKRQRRRRIIRRVTTAIFCVVVVVAGAFLVKTFVLDRQSDKDDYMVISGEGATEYFEGYMTTEASGAVETTGVAETTEVAETTQPSTEPITTVAVTTEAVKEPAAGTALSAQQKLDIASTVTMPTWIEQKFLDVNAYSRVGEKLTDINDIVIHWVANPGSSAADNWEYFDSLPYPQANPNGTKASAQFIVGLEGEVLQCMPLNEMAYAVKDKRNPDTISIEVCHPDWDGKFNDQSYTSVVKLTAWLLEQFHLDTTHILRHYDITGKDCPKYYVDHEDAWEQFKADVGEYMIANPNIQ